MVASQYLQISFQLLSRSLWTCISLYSVLLLLLFRTCKCIVHFSSAILSFFTETNGIIVENQSSAFACRHAYSVCLRHAPVLLVSSGFVGQVRKTGIRLSRSNHQNCLLVGVDCVVSTVRRTFLHSLLSNVIGWCLSCVFVLAVSLLMRFVKRKNEVVFGSLFLSIVIHTAPI